MIWTLLLSCCATLVLGNGTRDAERVPFFHGHVFENSPVGSRVNGLSIPARRVGAEPGARLRLLGDGSEAFRAFAHHKRGHVLLKTAAVLDRERRSGYVLGLAPYRRAASAAPPMASVRVDVLDTNDHEPAFRHAGVTLALDDATALRSVVHRVTAEDTDSGKNAELTYYALPRNGSFYVVPKTGDVLLVDSILGLATPVRFTVFARDRGWPSRTSPGVEIEVRPRQARPSVPAPNPQAALPRKSRRSVRDHEQPALVSVSEDAAVGSVIMSLSPARFQAAAYELLPPDEEERDPPVAVNRDSGELLISRNLDRETEPLVEVTVRVQDKRGESGDQLYCTSPHLT